MPAIAITSNPAKYVENEFKKIVTEANIRRMVFFDKNGTEKSLKDKSTYAKDATLSLAASSLDPATSGKARTLNFNASGDFFDFSDSDELSFGNGAGTDSAFSIVCYMNPNAITSTTILSKARFQTGFIRLEYEFGFDSSSRLRGVLYNSGNSGIKIGRYYNSDISSDVGNWHLYTMTYSGSKAASGISLYRDETKVDDTNETGGTYTTAGMSNTTTPLMSYILNTTNAKDRILNGKIGFIALIAEELTSTKISSINTLMKKYVGVA